MDALTVPTPALEVEIEIPNEIPISDIIVEERLRKDVGDLSDLDTIAEIGLIQPLILNLVNGRPTLVAGGRRLTRLQQDGYTTVFHGKTCEVGKPGFVLRNELPLDVRREIELYENLGRKDMTWQERVTSIAEIHHLKMHRSALDGSDWGLRESGAEVGLNFSTVSRMVLIAEELKNPESAIKDCKGVTDAIRWLVERRETEAKRLLAEMTSKTLPTVQSSAPTPVVEGNETEDLTQGLPLVVPITRMLWHGKMEELLAKFPEEFADNIITDWPYAIDMGNLSQSNGMDVSRVAAEHDVEENLRDFPIWLAAMFRALKPSGFCVIWCDVMHWNFMATEAQKCGFRVQRWPLVWVKTSPCLNQMAYKNWTKATEFAMVLSKGNALLVKTQATNYWSGPRASTTSNPFAKPKDLWQWIMSAVCARGETLLDPFSGEGSCTLAAIDFGLRPITIESNEDHFNQQTNSVRELYSELTKGNVRFE